jgi:uncharacterized membrane protein
MRSVRRAFIRGVVTLLPIAAVVLPAIWLYSTVATLPVLPAIEPTPLRVLVVVTLATSATLSAGYLMRTGVGRWLSGVVDRLMNTLVGIRTVYNAAKNSAETLFVGNGRQKGPAKISAGGDFRISAIRTGNRSPAGREIVFLPGAPDVTSGFVVEVDPDRLENADETTVSLGIRLISCGFSDGEGEVGVRRAGIEDLGKL